MHNAGRPRRELGAVLYQYNVLGTRGPRRMTAAIPALDARGNSRFQPTGPDDSILDRLKGGGRSVLFAAGCHVPRLESATWCHIMVWYQPSTVLMTPIA